jgi:hypothetical protein
MASGYPFPLKIIILVTRIMNTESTDHATIVVASLYEKVDFETLERMHICDRRDGVYRRYTWNYCVRDL